MRTVPNSSTLTPGSPRSLFLVPTRRTPRVRHIPSNRTLHLVDLENLMGGPRLGPAVMRQMISAYKTVAPVAQGDLVVIGTNPAIVVDAGLASPGSRVVMGSGPDGADRALLGELTDRPWIASHFDQVIVGSGDGIFADAVADLRQFGIPVGVVAPELGLSRALDKVASFVRLVPPPTVLRLVA